MGEAGSMSVGTIHIKNLEGAETENGISLKADNTVAEVVDGDDENVEWMAKILWNCSRIMVVCLLVLMQR